MLLKRKKNSVIPLSEWFYTEMSLLSNKGLVIQAPVAQTHYSKAKRGKCGFHVPVMTLLHTWDLSLEWAIIR